MLGKHVNCGNWNSGLSVWQSTEYVHSLESKGSTLEVWAFARTRGLILSQQFQFPDGSRLCRSGSSNVGWVWAIGSMDWVPRSQSDTERGCLQSPTAWVPQTGRKVFPGSWTLNLALVPDRDVGMFHLPRSQVENSLHGTAPTMHLFCNIVGQLLSGAGSIFPCTWKSINTSLFP